MPQAKEERRSCEFCGKTNPMGAGYIGNLQPLPSRSRMRSMGVTLK